MHRLVDWQSEISAIAGPYTGNRKSWLATAARRAGLSYSQIKTLWYDETSNPKISIALKIVRASQESRDNATKLASQFEQAAGTLNAQDKNFYSCEILTLIDAARALRGLDRA